MKQTPLQTFETSTIRCRLSKLFKTVGRSHHACKSGHIQKRDKLLIQKANLATSDYAGLIGEKFISTHLKAKHVRQITSEENMTEQNKEDSNEENRPLTPSDWVMFLSGEINMWHSRLNVICTVVIATGALYVSYSLVISNADNTTVLIIIGLIIIIILSVAALIAGFLILRQKIGKFTDIRNDIIYEKLKKYDEIRERCEEAGVFSQKQKK